jgi:hypothetical protein
VVIKVRSVWVGVPDAHVLRSKLDVAQDLTQPLRERRDALSYLSGAVKVMARLENRAALADYLQTKIRTLRATLYT